MLGQVHTYYFIPLVVVNILVFVIDPSWMAILLVWVCKDHNMEMCSGFPAVGDVPMVITTMILCMSTVIAIKILITRTNT